MSKAKYTAADLAAVSDNPQWTAHDFAKALTFDNACPDLATLIHNRAAKRAERHALKCGIKSKE